MESSAWVLVKLSGSGFKISTFYDPDSVVEIVDVAEKDLKKVSFRSIMIRMIDTD